MVAQVVAPRSLAPWWTEAKCHQHQPFPSELAAKRAASVHPFIAERCRKCDEGRRGEAFRCHSDPSHWHWGHGIERAEEEEATPMLAPPLPSTATPPKRLGGRPTKLTPQQAREIWVRYHRGEGPTEIARAYPTDLTTVIHIGKGRAWGWATTDLRAKHAEQQPAQEEPVQTTVPPTMIETNGTVAHEERTLLGISEQGHRALIADLCDAIEALLLPVPRFMQRDEAAIRALVERARAEA